MSNSNVWFLHMYKYVRVFIHSRQRTAVGKAPSLLLWATYWGVVHIHNKGVVVVGCGWQITQLSHYAYLPLLQQLVFSHCFLKKKETDIPILCSFGLKKKRFLSEDTLSHKVPFSVFTCIRSNIYPKYFCPFWWSFGFLRDNHEL